MKKLTLSLSAAVMVSIIVGASNPVIGQETIPTTTTSSTTTTAAAPTTTASSVTTSGTVSEFTPNDIEVRVSDQPSPIHYTFTKTTSYVDENGNPVSVETVRAGAPVVVYYEKTGDQFVADKVVVQKSVSSNTSIDQNSSQPLAPVPQASPQVAAAPQTSVPPKVDGVIKDADSDDISITSETSAEKMHYKAHDGTAYVDESGNPVSRHMLKEGTPVTIFYERDGDDMMATRVVVKSTGNTTSVPTEQQQSTTTQETQTTHIAQ